jgi:hypothetical protein
MEGYTQTRTASSEAVTEEFIAERRLWMAVVANAVEEWKSGTLRSRRAAQHFLFDNDDDFNHVCACAGLDARNLRSKLLKIGQKIEMHGPLTRSLAA